MISLNLENRLNHCYLLFRTRQIYTQEALKSKNHVTELIRANQLDNPPKSKYLSIPSIAAGENAKSSITSNLAGLHRNHISGLILCPI